MKSMAGDKTSISGLTIAAKLFPIYLEAVAILSMLLANVWSATRLHAYRFLMPSPIPLVISLKAVRISRYFAIRTMEWKKPVNPFVAF